MASGTAQFSSPFTIKIGFCIQCSAAAINQFAFVEILFWQSKNAFVAVAVMVRDRIYGQSIETKKSGL